MKQEKKREKYRHIVRDLLGISLIFIQGVIFFYIWIHYFNPYIRNPYRFKGNYFLLGVYLVLTLAFSNIYGGMKIGYYKVFDIILSQSICVFITNFVTYFAVIIPVATWYLSPEPLLWMTVVNILVVILWSVISNQIFITLFPPQRLLMLYTSDSDLLFEKFSGRPDRYLLEKRLQLNLKQRGCDKRAIESIVRECQKYDGVIIGDIKSDIRNDLLKRCYSYGIRTYTLPKVSDVILKSSETLHIFDSTVFLNRNYGLTAKQELGKRIFDLLISGIGILISSPILCLTAIMIKLEDGGPAFFKQKRCTKDGRVFNIIKFRSMIVDAEKEGEFIPATDKDPRITKTGSFIRMTRIDELPQLFNIFKGDMSIVGPRPERIEHVEKYTDEIPEFRYRLVVKGGLTGYAQIYGKYNTTPYDKLKLDLMYIQNYSLLLDISLILKTVKVIFTKESTEGFDKKI